MLEKGSPEAAVLFQLRVTRVNEKLPEKKPVGTAGATMGTRWGGPCTGFGDTLLLS